MGEMGAAATRDFLVRTQRIDLSCQVALTTLIIYNAVTRFDKEVKYFWVFNVSWQRRECLILTTLKSKPRSFISSIYLTNQYLGIFSMIVSLWHYFYVNKTFCAFSLISAFLVEWVILLEVEYILFLRVAAIFPESNRLVKALKLLYAAQGLLALIAVIYPFCVHHVADLEGHSGIGFCAIENGLPPLFQSLRCMGAFTFELVLVALVSYKAMESYKDAKGLRGFRLMRVLMQDQLAFFSWIFCCFFMHALALSPDLGGGPYPLLTIIENILHGSTLPCIIGSWLIVHLKEVAEKDSILVEDGLEGAELTDMVAESQLLSAMRFI